VVFLVECENGERFRLSADELGTESAAKRQASKAAGISDQAAIAACEESAKGQLRHPLTFKRLWTQTSVYRPPAAYGGNIVTTFTFEAKNEFGAALPQVARCIIEGDTGAMAPATISDR
jgi:hypothetical protein